MTSLEIQTSPAVASVFSKYPVTVQKKIKHLRKLILETAEETEGITSLVETLKWGEPSYIAKKGSTLRIDWKEKNPAHYAMYFKCTSKLVPTFKIIYKDIFTFEGNRAIIFKMNDRLPERELKKCIKSCLTYHKVKHLPLLGL